MTFSRRQFIRTSALGASILPFPLSYRSIPKRKYQLNESLNIGVIGCNGMGWTNTNTMLQNEATRLIGICDVDTNVSRNAEQKLMKRILMRGSTSQLTRITES